MSYPPRDSMITGKNNRTLRGNAQLLAFLVMLSCIACSVAQSQYRVIGYYPMWLRSSLPPGAVKFNYLTHLMHAFAWPDTNGSIIFVDPNIDTALINATHRAGRKILLSFGGAGQTQTANFAKVAADTALRRKFINNVLSSLTTNHYDGADLDWEGPPSRVDRANEAAMVRELRTAVTAVDATLLLTMAVGVSDWSGQWHDFDTLKQYVDWFNAMTYDIHGSWSAHTGHNAPLYAPASDSADGSVDQGIRYLHLTRGIPVQQLALGLAFFGQRFQNTAGLYKPFSTAGEVVFTDVETDLHNGWQYAWDAVSQVPYLVDPRKISLDSYDDTTSIAIKCAYAKANQLSGVMIWALGEDLWLGGQPLMEMVGKVMYGIVGVTAGRDETLVRGFALFSNYPNPFNPSTTIEYRIPAKEFVALTVYDVLGREVAILVNETQTAGMYRVTWSASGLASGVYFYRLRVGSFASTKSMLLLK